MFSFKGRTIDKICVVGSGQIGPDIALYFAKVFTPYDVPIVVIDVSEEALENGRAKVHKKIDKGIEARAFKPDAAEAMKANITFTNDYEAARGASLVVEAASESQEIKSKIFATLEELCPADAIFASNSSHMEPEAIFKNVDTKDRTMVIHYFFPAERNPIVEIVPGAGSDAGVVGWTMKLYEWMGKFPIEVKSRYGYAIDPIFEGIFQAAALCVEEGLGSVKEVDTVAREALRLGVGPFTAMNLTGGNPITHHGLGEMHDKIMPWFNPPRILTETLEARAAWEVAGRGEEVEVGDVARGKITDRMLGAYFGLVCEILDSGIVDIGDLELGVETGLVIGAPFRMMNKVGVADALRLVEGYAADHSGFKVAGVLRPQASAGTPWKVPVIKREDRSRVAVLTIRRPGVLNAINTDVMTQLREHLSDVLQDDNVDAIVLTGYGKKAFVSGADIGFLSKLDSDEAARSMCSDFQGMIQEFEDSPKPVVCAVNGVAFGGGCEIAMGCHARVAPEGAKFLFGQPEVNLGLIPGAGGTQRLPRIVDFDVAADMLRTGRPISSERALEIGLVDRLANGDVVDEAVALAVKIVSGEDVPAKIRTETMDTPESLGDIELGHLSKVVDEVLCRAIVEGARMTLADGLKHEVQLFAEVCKTEDSQIGLKNFMTKGARSKAEFVHR